MDLAGPDGKPLPKARTMPTRQEKFNMVYMMVTLMTTEERQMLRRSLKPLCQQLDFNYPNGMSEGDMKNDLTKAANAVVPDEQNDEKPQDAEIPAEQQLPVQPEGNADSKRAPADCPLGCGGCKCSAVIKPCDCCAEGHRFIEEMPNETVPNAG